MAERNKTIFISDIHLGDIESCAPSASPSCPAPHPYSWIKENIIILDKFLTEIRQDPWVKELVILGDLFDTWILPADKPPLTSFESICSNFHNRKIIDNLRDQKAWSKIEISYVLGNHDMAMSPEGIIQTQQFMKSNFPHIKCLFNAEDPLGKYEKGFLLAEHGNRYGLFNGVDKLSNPPSYLPIGYFISRFVGTKGLNTGKGESIWNIAENFIQERIISPKISSVAVDFAESLLKAVAADADFDPNKEINLAGLKGYETMKLESIGKKFRNLFDNWSGIDRISAVWSDIGNLWPAASYQMMQGKEIVIFGHSHKPEMKKDPETDIASNSGPVSEIPSEKIYANCGSWVDKKPGWFDRLGGAEQVCSYVEVETEEVKNLKIKRIHVRVKELRDLEAILNNMHKPLDFNIYDEGFVVEYL
jgi:UDP-2,3-diacylglucosamine pyrophosphatase LpxH